MMSNDEIEPCLTAVMPVYNEAATVSRIVKVVLAQRPVQQLVIVDDGSRDGTLDQLHVLAEGEPRIKLIRHEVIRHIMATAENTERRRIRIEPSRN